MRLCAQQHHSAGCSSNSCCLSMPCSSINRSHSLDMYHHLIVPKRFENLAGLLLSPSLVLLESVECFTLLVEEPAAAITRGVISERDPVLESVSSRRERTMKVRVDKFKREGAARSGLGEGSRVCLPSMHEGQTGIELGTLGAKGPRPYQAQPEI